MYYTFRSHHPYCLFCYLIGWFLSAQVTVLADSKEVCPMERLNITKLPSLNIPRAGHQLFYVNGEYVVAGGHTDGFVPTPTAEYFKDGEWHSMQMVYNHDSSSSVILKSGKVLLLGGSAEPIGIGQTFLAELYDPTMHTFNGFSSMELKRMAASGLELDNGQVVIAGNWYHDDGIEVFNGKRQFTYIKDATENRSGPFIFQTAKDDALIFSGFDDKGDSLHSSMADRLKGDPVKIPLFETWHPFCCMIHRSAESFIGDTDKNIYAYLLAVRNNTGQVAIAKMENGEVSLLPTACPVPTTTHWGDIEYYSTVIADQARGVAYLMGLNADCRSNPAAGFRHYVLRIDYAETAKGKSAPLTLYYTDPLQDAPDYSPVLTPEGNLLIAGGLTTAQSNFTPSKEVLLILVGSNSYEAKKETSSWIWAIPFGILLIALLCYLIFIYRKKKLLVTTVIKPDERDYNILLMERIRTLMEEERVFLNPELKISDVAEKLGIHRNMISNAINSQMNCTFNQFVNSYRTEHAKALLRQQPDMKLSSVAMESGFANEQTFFRTFKTSTGKTPREWIAITD